MLRRSLLEQQVDPCSSFRSTLQAIFFSWLVVVIIILKEEQSCKASRNRLGQLKIPTCSPLGSPGDIISWFYPAVSGRFAPLAAGKASG